MTGLKTSRAPLALALLMILAGAAPAGAVTTRPHHTAATHHTTAHASKAGASKAGASKAGVGRARAARTGAAKTSSRHHVVKGHARRHGKTTVAKDEPTHRHAQLCRGVMVHHKEVEKCR